MNADCLIWKWFFFTSLKRQRSAQLNSAQSLNNAQENVNIN